MKNEMKSKAIQEAENQEAVWKAWLKRFMVDLYHEQQEARAALQVVGAPQDELSTLRASGGALTIVLLKKFHQMETRIAELEGRATLRNLTNPP
jgi:hypothetical protein